MTTVIEVPGVGPVDLFVVGRAGPLRFVTFGSSDGDRTGRIVA